MENTANFIGTGKQVGKSEFKGKKYLTVDVLTLKETSQYGKTHAVIEHIHLVKETAEATS
jgi:hypothetical protein